MRRGSTSGVYSFWTERLSPSTVAILWALVAARWRTKANAVTYRLLARMLGISHRTALRRAVVTAESTGLVKVRDFGARKVVSLTPGALRLLEKAPWTRSR